MAWMKSLGASGAPLGSVLCTCPRPHGHVMRGSTERSPWPVCKARRALRPGTAPTFPPPFLPFFLPSSILLKKPCFVTFYFEPS